MGIVCYDFGGERNVSGDDQVPGLQVRDDVLVCLIEAARNLDHPDQRGGGRMQLLVLDERQRTFCTLCGRNRDVLDD